MASKAMGNNQMFSLMFSATEEFCDVLKPLVRTGEVNVRTYAAAGEAVEARGGPQAPCRR